MSAEKIEQITNIIRANSYAIVDFIYPQIPMGNHEISFIIGTEDGDFTEKMNVLGISFGRTYFLNACYNNDPEGLIHAAMTLAGSEILRQRISNRDADAYFESDGHYETGNTREKNRERFFQNFPTFRELMEYYRSIQESALTELQRRSRP